MSTSGATQPVVLRWTPQLVALLVVAAALWLLTLDRAAGMGAADAMGGMGTMGAAGGTMGLSVGAFAAMWALMMAAMMLPSVAPVAVLYARTFTERRALRLTVFTSTYLLAWALSALPAWVLLRGVDEVTGSGRGATALASAVLVVVGAWQLSALKERCLSHCRSPIGQLFRYGSWRGPGRDVRVAAHHAVYCLGCCWGLMAVFVVSGAMHVGAMVGLAAVVAAEKLLPWGRQLSRATGVLALGAAVAVWWVPALAPGLA